MASGQLAQNSSERISGLHGRLTRELPCLLCDVGGLSQAPSKTQINHWTWSAAGDLGQPVTGTIQQGCQKLHTMTEDMHAQKLMVNNLRTQSDYQTSVFTVLFQWLCFAVCQDFCGPPCMSGAWALASWSVNANGLVAAWPYVHVWSAGRRCGWPNFGRQYSSAGSGELRAAVAELFSGQWH